MTLNEYLDFLDQKKRRQPYRRAMRAGWNIGVILFIGYFLVMGVIHAVA